MSQGKAFKREVSGLEAHAGYWLRHVSNHVSQAFARKLEASGVTVAEWVVMRQMYGREELTPGAVAAETGLTRGGGFEAGGPAGGEGTGGAGRAGG